MTEVGGIWVDVHADGDDLPAEVRRAAERAAKAAVVEVDLELERGAEKSLKVAAERAARRAQTDVVFGADADFGPMIAEAKAAAKAAKVSIEVEAHLDKKGFTKDVNGIFRDLSGKAASLGDLGDALVDFGTKTGGISGALGKIPPAAGAAGVAIAQAVALALPVVLSLGAAVVALAGQLAFAAGGAAFGLVGALGAVAAAAAVVMIGTQGLGDAFKAVSKAQEEMAATGKVSADTLKAQEEALKGLAPEAREFVLAVSSVRDSWADMAKEVQGALFADLGTEIQRLTVNLLPTLQTGLTAIAGTLNQAAVALADWAGSTQGAEQIAAILTIVDGVLGSLLRAVGGFGSGFLTLFEGAGPQMQEFADAIAGIGESFGDWAKGFSESGGLTAFLDQAMEAGSKLWGILTNVGSILGSLFGGSADLGSGLLTSIEEITGRLADFLNSAEGQEAMSTFFEQMGVVLGTVKDAVIALWPAFSGFLAGVIAAWPSVQAFVAGLGALGPVLQIIGFAFGLLLGTLGSVITLFGIVVTWAQQFGGLGGVFSAFGQVVQGVFTSIGAAISGFFSGVLGAVGGWLSGVGASIAAFASGVPGFFAGLASRVWAAAGNMVGAFTGWVAGVAGAVTGFIGRVLGQFAGFAARVWAGAGSLASAFTSWASGVIAAVGRLITDIIGQFAGLAGRIVNAIGTIIPRISLPSIGGAASGTIAGAASGIAVTRGPQLRLIGEAGPEAIVPLRTNQSLDPSVEALLMRVAENRGMVPESGAAPNITVVVPTDDPEAAAMAVWNRLVFEGVA